MKRLNLIAAFLALLAACAGGHRNALPASEYFQRLAMVLSGAETARANVASPNLNGDDTLDASERAEIRARFQRIGSIFKNAADEAAELAPPRDLEVLHTEVVRSLRQQSDGLLRLSNEEPDIDTLNSSLEREVFPAQRSFKTACQELQSAADASKIDASLTCVL